MQNFALKVKDHPKHYDPGYSLVQLTLIKSNLKTLPYFGIEDIIMVDEECLKEVHEHQIKHALVESILTTKSMVWHHPISGGMADLKGPFHREKMALIAPSFQKIVKMWTSTHTQLAHHQQCMNLDQVNNRWLPQISAGRLYTVAAAAALP